MGCVCPSPVESTIYIHYIVRPRRSCFSPEKLFWYINLSDPHTVRRLHGIHIYHGICTPRKTRPSVVLATIFHNTFYSVFSRYINNNNNNNNISKIRNDILYATRRWRYIHLSTGRRCLPVTAYIMVYYEHRLYSIYYLLSCIYTSTLYGPFFYKL